MHIKSLSLKGFRTVGEIEVQFPKTGLILVEGDNRDNEAYASNGAGKSSLWEGLQWIIDGTNFRGTNAAKLVNPKLKRMCGELVIEVDNKEYHVVRSRKDKKYKTGVQLFEKSEEKPLTLASVPQTNKLIVEKLKYAPEIFQNCILVGQGMPHKFVDMAPKDRRNLVEAFVGSLVYDKAYDLAFSELREKRTTVSTHTAALESLKSREASLERALAEEVERRSSAKKESELKIMEYEQNIDSWTVEKETKEKEVAEFSNIILGLDTVIDNMIVVHRNIRAELVPIQAKKSELFGSLNVWNKHVKDKETLSGKECPTCGKDVEGDYVEEWLKDTKAQIMVAEKEFQALQVQLEEVELREADVGTRLGELTKNRNANSSDHGYAQQHINQLEHKISDAVRNKDKLASRIKEDESGAASYRSQIEVVSEQIVEADKELQVELQEVDLLNFWRIGFPKIKSQCFMDVLDYLNDRLNTYMEFLTGGEMQASLICDPDKGINDLEVAISSSAGTYSDASGGEKRRIDVAMAFALADFAMHSSGFRTNLRIYDEVLDSLDKVGCQRVLSLLRDRAAEDNLCIFVVTQNDDIRHVGSDYFTDVWTVVKEEGVSSLRIGA